MSDYFVQISFDSIFLQYLVKTLVSLLLLFWLENNSRFAAISSVNLSWEICSEIALCGKELSFPFAVDCHSIIYLLMTTLLLRCMARNYGCSLHTVDTYTRTYISIVYI
jgi:hypothetical protein